MGSFDAADVQRAVDLVGRVAERPVLVGIDGHGGAGKSTLARQLDDRLPKALVVEGDDFYRLQPEAERLALDAEDGYDRYFDWERLRDQVLAPVRERRPRLRYQRYDWEHDAMDGWVAVAMPAIVIVEGVYTLRPQLRPLVDIAIVVETGEQTRLDRQVARGENSAAWIRRWAAAEDHYMRKHPPAPHADLVLLGE